MAQYEAKTKPTHASVTAHVAAITDPERRADCRTLIKLMRRLTGERPVLWGPSIIGFGHVQYRYPTGHSGETCAAAFASRKGDLSIYLLVPGPTQKQLLARLGRHKMGKCCLYIRRLSDVDPAVLEQVIADSVAGVRRLYPAPQRTARATAKRQNPSDP